MKLIGNKWDEILSEEYAKPYFVNMLEKVNSEYARFKVYPPQNKVFNAFKLTDFDNIKVVILGQDPYHQPGQAHGLCFSVLPGVEPPPSLKNIYKELKNEGYDVNENNGCLINWTRQGVLLLNTVLTVRESLPQSHKNIGWLDFTDSVIKNISDKKQGVVFLLWGRNAIDKKKIIDESKHICLTAPHPSPLSAYNGFFGCNHFKKCNEILKKQGKKEINWQV